MCKYDKTLFFKSDELLPASEQGTLDRCATHLENTVSTDEHVGQFEVPMHHLDVRKKRTKETG